MTSSIPALATPLITFHMAYLGEESSEDKTYEMKSLALPMVGELVVPTAGAKTVLVVNVIHKTMSHDGVCHLLVPTVVVQEPKTLSH